MKDRIRAMTCSQPPSIKAGNSSSNEMTKTHSKAAEIKKADQSLRLGELIQKRKDERISNRVIAKNKISIEESLEQEVCLLCFICMSMYMISSNNTLIKVERNCFFYRCFDSATYVQSNEGATE